MSLSKSLVRKEQKKKKKDFKKEKKMGTKKVIYG